MASVERVTEETRRVTTERYSAGAAPAGGGGAALAVLSQAPPVDPKVAEVFRAKASAAVVAQHRRWQDMAGEVRAASRGTRGSLGASVALLERRSRQLGHALTAVDDEARRVAQKGREATTAAEHFFVALLAQVEAKRAEVLMGLKEEQAAKEWALLQQSQRLVAAKATCEEAAKEGRRIETVENELELLETAAPVQAYINEAIAQPVFDDPANMRPCCDAEFESDVSVAASTNKHGTRSVPEFLVPTFAQWCRPREGDSLGGAGMGSAAYAATVDPFMAGAADP